MKNVYYRMLEVGVCLSVNSRTKSAVSRIAQNGSIYWLAHVSDACKGGNAKLNW